MIDLSRTPVFAELPATTQAALLGVSEVRQIAAGETVFQEGDAADRVWLHKRGDCMLSRHTQPLRPARRGDMLDAVAVLGGLPHTLRAIARTDCEFLTWPAQTLWNNPDFADVARRYIATELIRTQQRLSELEAPIHYPHALSVQLNPGPFVFNNTMLLLALCDAQLDDVALPDGVNLFRRVGRSHDSLLLAFADFKQAYPDNLPDARFDYTETTCFVPVRHRTGLGLYPLQIYSSAWEPILLGREIYGFSKRLGQTVIEPGYVAVQVDGESHFSLSYTGAETASEPRLIGSLGDWLGLQGRVTETVFRVGDGLMNATGLYFKRRVSVYNHKQILAPGATHENPAYDVNCLTHAMFSVVHWQQLDRISNPSLSVVGGPFAHAHVRLREAYLTTLNMRLSTGRVVRNYLAD